MRKFATTLLGVTLVLCSASAAFAANKYPPGPAYRTCPDTLTIFDLEQSDSTIAPCTPARLDTVRGVKGIITGFDAKASAYGFYIQNNATNEAYTGVDVFTGATNYNGAPYSLALGDSVAVYGTMQEFPNPNGLTEIEGPDAVQSTNDIIIRKINSGNPLPPFQIVTTTEINWVPALSNGERWEGCLVRVRGPLHVGRASTQGGSPLMPFNSFLFVSNANTADSVVVDGNTLTTFTPLTAGTAIDSIQGIMNQGTSSSINSYRLQIRNGNDVFVRTAPDLTDAYPVEDDTLRLVFSRDLDQTTAEMPGNYSLASGIDGSTVNSAIMESVPGNVVRLGITSVRVDGDIETITAQDIGSATCPTCTITPPQSRTFVNGVLDISTVQAADPAFSSPCDDRSRFAGVGAIPGTKFTFRGVGIGQYGTLSYLQDAAGGQRSGISIFGPLSPITRGHRYRIAGQVQEFNGETEVVSDVYQTDEGMVGEPSATLQSIAVLRDTTCNITGPSLSTLVGITNGEDYEGMLVKLHNVRMTETRTIGQSWFAGGPCCTFPDTILVSNLNSVLVAVTPPDSASTVDVTGVLHFSSGSFRICPRDAGDIVNYGINASANSALPAEIAFSVYPNPSRTARVSFALPKRDLVDIGVFDIAGRRIATVAKGAFDAGTYSRAWDGLDGSGKTVGAGVYFYRLRVGAETRIFRAVKLN